VGRLVEQRFGLKYSASQIWRILSAMGSSCQRPAGRARERDEQAIGQWKHKRWPGAKKNASAQGRVIVFVDESGLSERPTRVRTCAPRGHPPRVLQYCFNWHQLSVIAGVTFYRFYCRLFPGTIKGPQVIEFCAPSEGRSSASCWSSGTGSFVGALSWAPHGNRWRAADLALSAVPRAIFESLVCPNVSPDDAILRPSGRWPRPVRTGFGEGCGYWMLPAISGTRGAMRWTVSSESQCRM
jgi:hypothetical protein